MQAITTNTRNHINQQNKNNNKSYTHYNTHVDLSKSSCLAIHPNNPLIAYSSTIKTFDDDFNIKSLLTIWNKDHNTKTSIEIDSNIQNITFLNNYILTFTEDSNGSMGIYYYREDINVELLNEIKQNKKTDDDVNIDNIKKDIEDEFEQEGSFDLDELDSSSKNTEDNKSQMIKSEENKIEFNKSQIVKLKNIETGITDNFTIKALPKIMMIVQSTQYCSKFYILNHKFNIDRYLENSEEDIKNLQISDDLVYLKKTFSSNIKFNTNPISIDWNPNAQFIIAIACRDSIIIYSIKKKSIITKIYLNDIKCIKWNTNSKSDLFILTEESLFLYKLNSDEKEWIGDGGFYMEIVDDFYYIIQKHYIHVLKSKDSINAHTSNTLYKYNNSYLELENSIEFDSTNIKNINFALPYISILTNSNIFRLTTLNSIISENKKNIELLYLKNKIFTTDNKIYAIENKFNTNKLNINELIYKEIMKNKKNFDLVNLDDKFYRNMFLGEENELSGEIEVPIKFFNTHNNKSDELLDCIENIKSLIVLSNYFKNYKKLSKKLKNTDYNALCYLLIRNLEKDSSNTEIVNILDLLRNELNYPMNAYVSLILKKEKDFINLMKNKIDVFDYYNIMDSFVNDTNVKISSSNIDQNKPINYSIRDNISSSKIVSSNINQNNSNFSKISSNIKLPPPKTSSNFNMPPPRTTPSNINNKFNSLKISSDIKIPPPKMPSNMNIQSIKSQSNIKLPPPKMPSNMNIQSIKSQSNIKLPPPKMPSNMNIQSNIKLPPPKMPSSNISNKFNNLKTSSNMIMPPQRIHQTQSKNNSFQSVRQPQDVQNLNKPLQTQSNNSINNINTLENILSFDQIIEKFNLLISICSLKKGVIYRSRLRNAENAKNSMLSNKDSITPEVQRVLSTLFLQIDIDELKKISDVSQSSDKNTADELKSNYKNTVLSSLVVFGNKMMEEFEDTPGVKIWIDSVTGLVRCVIS